MSGPARKNLQQRKRRVNRLILREKIERQQALEKAIKAYFKAKKEKP